MAPPEDQQDQQDQQIDTEPYPIYDGKNNNTTFLERNKSWLLLGVGTAAVGGGGYYLYKKYKKKKDSSGNLLIDHYYDPAYPGTNTSSSSSGASSPSTTKIVAHPTTVTSGVKAPTIVVEIHDSSGNKVDTSGKVVSLSCSQNNCSLGGVTSVTTTNGVAQFNDIIFSSNPGEVTLSAQSEFGSDTSPQKVTVTTGNNRQ